MKGLICSVSSNFMEPIYDFKELEEYGQRKGSSVRQPGICTFRCDVELDSSLEYFITTESMTYFVSITECLGGKIKAFITRKPSPIKP